MENLLVNGIILVLSLYGLIFFSEKLIESSVSLARGFGVSEAVIGLTLLAYGTSLPEFAVSSISSVGSHPELSVSNVIGSNIANIALVIGLAAFIRPFSIKEKQLGKRDNYIMMISTVILIIIIFSTGGIERYTGVLMVLSIVGYTLYTLWQDRTDNKIKKDETVSVSREISTVLFGLLVLIISGKLAVDSAVVVAKGLGVTEWMIGATIIALGTSLPELAVSMTAAKRGLFGMFIGNIVGSNIFNILWVLGSAATLNTLTVNFNIIKLDLFFLFLITFLFGLNLIRSKFSRMSGIVFIVLYLGYITYLLTQ